MSSLLIKRYTLYCIGCPEATVDLFELGYRLYIHTSSFTECIAVGLLTDNFGEVLCFESL